MELIGKSIRKECDIIMTIDVEEEIKLSSEVRGW